MSMRPDCTWPPCTAAAWHGELDRYILLAVAHYLVSFPLDQAAIQTTRGISSTTPHPEILPIHTTWLPTLRSSPATRFTPQKLLQSSPLRESSILLVSGDTSTDIRGFPSGYTNTLCHRSTHGGRNHRGRRHCSEELQGHPIEVQCHYTEGKTHISFLLDRQPIFTCILWCLYGQLQICIWSQHH